MRRPLTLLALAATLVLPASGQGKTEKHPELGLSLARPIDYEPLPVRANARFCVLAYVEELSVAQLASGESPASLHIYVVPRSGVEGETVVDAESFLKHEVGGVTKELHPGRSRYGYEPRRWEAAGRGADGKMRGAYVHAWEGEERTIVLEGRCAPEAYATERRVWERVADGMRMFSPTDVDEEREKLERYYAQRRFSNVDFRIDVRLSMVEGWDVRDTEHYIVLHHDVDDGFVRRLCTEVEALRREYARHCPPDRNLDAVSTIRICRDEAEYKRYGGWEGSVGYWSSGEEELVLFDASQVQRPGFDGQHYTMAVLFHEAFHQYVHASADQMSPDSWYGEGMAEYFGGATISNGRLRELEPNRYRLATIQESLRDGETYPWKVVVELTQEQFYADPVVLYAQGWSMVHFLQESPLVERNPKWRRILPTYFRTLRASWASERRKLRAISAEAVQEGFRRSREKARKSAFQGVDWDDLEAAWRSHVLELRMPEAR